MTIRKLLPLALVSASLTVSACATGAGGGAPAPITPTERYTLKAEKALEQVAFAPHAEGLSDGQRAALGRFYQNWSEAQGGDISISAPADGGEPANRVAWAAKAQLQQLGVAPGAVHVDAYRADKAGAPVLIAYDTYKAVVPECNRSWTNLAATRKNDGQQNFGCALTANLAAQIANPRDIKAPQAMTPADAGRRAEVLEKYRKGEPTAAKADEQAGGKVATSVQN
ncbi:MAG: CpaD family pilus assembly protein [Proteobacteria bacterium]|nr:CpaD family pilus assembly protein [Pseudomonadota bacterium]